MPTYEYRCTKCGHAFETFQRFDDPPVTECPNCGAPVQKVFSSVGVVFKGSGFYSTDNHKSTKPPKPAKEAKKDAPAPAKQAPAPAPAASAD